MLTAGLQNDYIVEFILCPIDSLATLFTPVARFRFQRKLFAESAFNVRCLRGQHYFVHRIDVRSGTMGRSYGDMGIRCKYSSYRGYQLLYR